MWGVLKLITFDRKLIAETSKTRSTALKRVKIEGFLEGEASFEIKLGTFVWDSTRLQRVAFVSRLAEMAADTIKRFAPDDVLPVDMITLFKQYYLLESSVNMNELLRITEAVRESVVKRRSHCTTPFLNRQINIWLGYVVLESVADILEGGTLNQAETLFITINSMLNTLRVSELFELDKDTSKRLENFDKHILNCVRETWK